MIVAHNNDYDLETIEVAAAAPFTVGHTLPGRECGRDWLVHYRDETTLLVAPVEHPDAWVPCHIYSRGRIGDLGWVFVLANDEWRASASYAAEAA